MTTGRDILQTVIDHDSGKSLSLAANAVSQAQGLLQRPTSNIRQPEPIGKETIVEEAVTSPVEPEQPIEEITEAVTTAVPEEPKIEEIVNEKVNNKPTNSIDNATSNKKVAEPGSKMMSSVYKWEGGYQQMKKDNGNYTTSGKLIGTNKGINAKTLESYLGKEPTVNDMKNLDQETISTIYREEFYNRYKIYKLPEELQTVAMHALVTGGPKTIKYLQELAGTKQDMLIGDKTIKAIKDKGITAEQLKNKVLSKYKNFDNWEDYGKGWTNRFNDIQN